MTKRFIMTLPGKEQEFEFGLPVVDNDDYVFTIITRESKFRNGEINIICKADCFNSGDEQVQMGSITITDDEYLFTYGFDFMTEDIGTVHIDVHFMEGNTQIEVSF